MVKYSVAQTHPAGWSVGYWIPGTSKWERDSDHRSLVSAESRADWLNGPLDGDLVYRETESGLWTVGYFDAHGPWNQVDHWTDREEAARRVADRNGSDVEWPTICGRPLS